MSTIPDTFVCPLTKKMFVDPVMCSDCHTYERSAIEDRLRTDTTSPMTNEKLESGRILPNIALRNAIAEWKLTSTSDAESDSDIPTAEVHMTHEALSKKLCTIRSLVYNHDVDTAEFSVRVIVTDSV